MIKDPKKTKVTIFGAGVAGLSAAHELVTRGFSVEVIAPELNLELRGDTLDRGVGGMARSQFACDIPAESLSNKHAMERWISTTNFLVDETIAFLPQAEAMPADQNRAITLMDRAATAIRWLDANTGNPYSLRINIPGESSRPALTVPEASAWPSFDSRRNWVSTRLNERLADLEPKLDLSRFIRQSMVFDGSDDPRLWVTFSIGFPKVPAEHGFRFFPSFYRHLFDTMKRTEILVPKDSELGRLTVYDNLIATDGLGLARKHPFKSFLVPRTPILSFEVLRKYLDLVLSDLQYTIEDIARYQLKLFKYMTSCTERRRYQYENMSWGDFVELQRFSPVCRQHIEFGPQMTAALRGSLSDARTQGTITVQLILDQLRTATHVDSTLDGPSSGAWLDHWHRFLCQQDVQFQRNRLIDFHVAGGKVLPVLENASSAGANTDKTPSDYFILALSLPEIHALAPKLLAACATAGHVLPSDNDLERVLRFVERDLAPGEDLATDLRRAMPNGPLQHLSGIQFYFATDVRFWRGHTQYLDAPWGLTSISQPQFWSRARGPNDRYRSVLSVDIGIWDKPYRGRIAWDCDADQLATYTWEQIQEHHLTAFHAKYGHQAKLPQPIAYALDNDIMLSGRRDARHDNTPFLVNRTSAYPLRPGRLDSKGGDRASTPCYQLLAGHYVLAGTFVQTYTRLTSMEAANESARHAVNAVIAAAGTETEPCEIWDPEAHELPDLAWLIELDHSLWQRHLPHFIDILEWQELPAQIMPHHLAGLLKKRAP